MIAESVEQGPVRTDLPAANRPWRTGRIGAVSVRAGTAPIAFAAPAVLLAIALLALDTLVPAVAMLGTCTLLPAAAMLGTCTTTHLPPLWAFGLATCVTGAFLGLIPHLQPRARPLARSKTRLRAAIAPLGYGRRGSSSHTAGNHDKSHSPCVHDSLLE